VLKIVDLMVDIRYGDGREVLKKDFGLKSWLSRKLANA